MPAGANRRVYRKDLSSLDATRNYALIADQLTTLRAPVEARHRSSARGSEHILEIVTARHCTDNAVEDLLIPLPPRAKMFQSPSKPPQTPL